MTSGRANRLRLFVLCFTLCIMRTPPNQCLVCASVLVEPAPAWLPKKRNNSANSCPPIPNRLLTEDVVVSKTFKRFGLRWDVTTSFGPVGGDPEYPYIQLASLIEALDAAGRLSQLLGCGENVRTLREAGPFLEDFWKKFEVCHGTHEVFSLAKCGKLRLDSCVPLYLHGDAPQRRLPGALCTHGFWPGHSDQQARGRDLSSRG